MKLKRVIVVNLGLLLAIGLLTGCLDKAKLNESLNDPAVPANIEEAQGTAAQTTTVNTGLQCSMNVLPLMLELTKDLSYDVVAVGKDAAIEAVNTDISQLGIYDGQLEEAQGLAEIIAYAGVTLIVNSKSGLDNITSEEVRAFFTGETTELQGQTLTMVLPEKSLPSRTLFEMFFPLKGDVNGMQKSLIPDTALTAPSDAEVIAEVANNPNAIGVILTGSLDAQVKGLKLEGIEATSSTLSGGTYIATTPIVLMAKASNEGEFNTFLELTKSEQGQEMIKNIGFTTTN